MLILHGESSVLFPGVPGCVGGELEGGEVADKLPVCSVLVAGHGSPIPLSGFPDLDASDDRDPVTVVVHPVFVADSRERLHW